VSVSNALSSLLQLHFNPSNLSGWWELVLFDKLGSSELSSFQKNAICYSIWFFGSKRNKKVFVNTIDAGVKIARQGLEMAVV